MLAKRYPAKRQMYKPRSKHKPREPFIECPIARIEYVNTRLVLFKKFLDEGWSTSMAKSKAGISYVKNNYGIFDDPRFKELIMKYNANRRNGRRY